MATHEKIDRKELSAPDEFQVVSRTALDWAQGNRVLIGVAALAIVAAGLIGGVMNSQRAKGHDAAAVAFRDARGQFAASKFQEAAAGFAQVAAGHADTAFGRLATLYRGHAMARQGDLAGAVATYGEFIAGQPEPFLRQQALLGIAAAKESSSDLAGALAAFTEARDLTGPFKAEATVGAARVQDAQGQHDAARALYVELLKESTLDPATRALVESKVPPEARPTEPVPPGS